jgi:hypothetical protein
LRKMVTVSSEAMRRNALGTIFGAAGAASWAKTRRTAGGRERPSG